MRRMAGIAVVLALVMVGVNMTQAKTKPPSLGVHFNNGGISSGGAEVSCDNWYDVSAGTPGINYWGPYTDDQGKGSVTVNWGRAGQSSVYNGGGFGGRAPLLRGEAKMHYYGQEWGMTGIGYAVYDVFLYSVFNSGNSFTIDVPCTNGLTQSVTTGGGDPGPPNYIMNVNYLVWRNVTNDHFHLTGSEKDLCALQIVEVPQGKTGCILIVR